MERGKRKQSFICVRVTGKTGIMLETENRLTDEEKKRKIGSCISHTSALFFGLNWKRCWKRNTVELSIKGWFIQITKKHICSLTSSGTGYSHADHFGFICPDFEVSFFLFFSFCFEILVSVVSSYVEPFSARGIDPMKTFDSEGCGVMEIPERQTR